MTKVTAIFERGVFRPIEPVNVDDGARVELSYEETGAAPSGEVKVTIGEHGLPVFTPPGGGRPITSEDVARALEDE